MERVKIKSLQLQYAVFSSVLVMLIVFAILYNRSIVAEQNELLSKQRNQVVDILIRTTKLRDHVNTITNSIDIVMLDPKMKSQIDLIFTASFNEILALADGALKNDIVGEKESIFLGSFKNNIILFKNYAKELFDIRSNVDRQYPSMGFSNSVMLTVRNEINSIFKISIDEAEEDRLFKDNNRAYEALISARRQWDKTVSLYRLYLANKLAATVREDFFIQEAGIEDAFKQSDALIEKVLSRVKKDEYGFQATDQLHNLPQEIKVYKDGFEQVKVIHNSEKWRMDSYFMRNSILPIVGEIIDNLQSLDLLMYEKNDSLVKKTSELSEQQLLYLVMITVIFVIYSLVVSIFLRKLVFKPLSLFSNSIRAQDFKLDEVELLRLANTKETFVLIDSFIDMHRQSLARREELAYQALHDSLTKLPNRKALLINLKQNIKAAHRDNKKLSFFMLDLNKFKDVNDTLGHLVGDDLLIKVGERLSKQLREVDLVARLGGDEFSIVLPGTSRKDASLVAIKIHEALKESFHVEDYALHIGVSIGITEYPSDGKTSTELMQYADVAMYNSKRHGTIYSYYDPEKDTHSLGGLSLTQDLKQAIKDNSFFICYQPKLSVFDEKIIGSEALLRWNHPSLGYVSPEHIIELAESSGLIDDLTLLIIKNTLNDQIELKRQGFDLKIAINLSVHNLKDKFFVQNTKRIIDENDIDAESITFEITESAMMADPKTSIRMMNSLTEIGVKLSVDDFGTGFSSLAYLKKLPVSELKIDRSFVNDIAIDQSDKVIVQSTIDLSHNLGLTVVAEGVEDEKSLSILKTLGCDVSQGYYFSKPLNIKDYIEWLKKNYK